MAQTQQYDALDDTSGADLEDKIGWVTVGNLGATTGNFTLYNSGNKTLANGIIGAYHKPANAATKTGANIARAWLTGGAGGILSETSVTVSVRHRISSNVNGSNNGWPTAGVSGTDIVFGVILRANGTDYATHNWYEFGFSALSGQSTGTIIIRRVNAGTTTTVSSQSISLPFKYPAYSTATSPANTPANLWTKITGTATPSGSNVLLTLIFEVDPPGNGGGALQATDSSGSKITTAGYGGFWTSGNADSVDSLVSHFRDFVLTVNAGGATDPTDPTDAFVAPSLTAEPTLTSLSVLPEQDAALAVTALPVQPQYVVPCSIEYFTNELLTDAGYVATQAKYPNARRIYQLKWENMSDADSNSLIDFVVARKGGELAFSWSPPFYSTSIKFAAIDGTFRTTVNDVGVRGAELFAMEVFAT